MAGGINKHGLPGQPGDLSEELLRKLAQRLGVVEGVRTDTGILRGNVATVRKNLRPRTIEIERRLSATIRGHYGRHSKELAAYGLKVHAVTRKPRRKAPPPVMVMPVPAPANGAARA